MRKKLHSLMHPVTHKNFPYYIGEILAKKLTYLGVEMKVKGTMENDESDEYFYRQTPRRSMHIIEVLLNKK